MASMFRTATTDVPDLQCPVCFETWEESDYYDIKEGGELECPNCDKTLHILSVDTILSITLGFEVPNESEVTT
jgi:hypothetical protein